MATTRRIRRTTRTPMIRRGIVIVAILAALLSTHMVGLASNDLAQFDDRNVAADQVTPLYELGVVNGTVEDAALDIVIIDGDQPAAAKPGVSVWGKCQVPGKCEIGVSIKIRF